MKRESENFDDYSHRASLEITDAHGKCIGGFSAGSLADCAEDANLGRDFSWYYEVPQWLKAAHAAGVAGEPLEVVDEEVESIW